MKKGLVAALSGLCILSTSLGIVACTNPNTDSGSDVPVSITTLTPEFEYHVGDNVHMFDHFSYVDGLTYTFTVQYEDEEAVTVEGDAYYLAEAGNYKITCEASNGKESKKESVTITVGNEKAFIQFKNREAQVDWKKIMWDTDIIALADPITIVDCEYETYIESVVIYDAADGSGRTVVIEDGVKIEDDAGVFYNGNDKFTFVYECDYVFTIVCETSGGKVSDKLTVSAKENFDSLQVLSDYSASYNADTFTANWDAVTGASSYYVKVDRKQMVTEETSVNIESLIVSDFQYFDLYIVPLDSEGNRLGKIICEDIVIAPEGAEGIVKGPGASIDVAAKKATLVGYQAASAGYESGIRHVKNSYIAYGYKYGVGTYVDFTFTGNNMPQVCFFANEVNGNMTCHSGSVHQSTPNEGYLFMNGLNVTGDVKGKDSFICVGPYRFGCKDHGNHINYTEITEGSTKRFIISKNSLFTYNGLEAAGSDKEYIYTVGSFTSGGCLAFELILRDADTQEVLETARIVTAQSAATVKAGHIIAYAGVKGNGTQTTFGYGEPYQGTPLPVYEQGVTHNDDGSVTLDGKASPGSYVYHVAQVDNSYVSIQGEYGLDTYIDINFKGNNMPQVLLFADQINGNMTSMGGKGVLFSNGLVTANPAGSILRKYSIYGPNRIYLYGGLSDTDKVVKDTNTYEGSDSRVINNSYWTLLGYDSSGNVSDYPFLTQKGLATSPDTEYKYTLGMCEKDGIVYAHIELYDVTNDIEVYNFNQATTLSASDLTAGNIILYGSVAGATTTTTFSYSEPYTKTQETPDDPENPDDPTIPEGVKSSGATFNDDGSVTLAGKASPGGYVYHIAQLDNSYVALEGEYGIGTYIDITFTGNNMPQVMFFADEINGNMTSMGGAGVLFSNGLVTANPAGSMLRKYSIFGPNRITLHGGITDSDKVVANTNNYDGSDSRLFTLMGYDSSGNEKDYPYLTQKGLATTPDTTYKYTVGTFENNYGKLSVAIKLYNVTDEAVVYEFVLETTLPVNNVSKGSIILYGSVAGTANTTTFSYSKPYISDAQAENVLGFEDGVSAGAEFTAQNGAVAATSDEQKYSGEKSMKFTSLSQNTAFRLYNFKPINGYYKNDIISLGMYVYLDAPSGACLKVGNSNGDEYTYLGALQSGVSAGEWTYVVVDVPVSADDSNKYLDISFALNNYGASLDNVNVYIDDVKVVYNSLEGYTVLRTSPALGGNKLYMLPSLSGGQSLSFVIQNSDGEIILLDGGYVGDGALIEAVVKSLRPDGKVTAWLITHGHDDHMGVVAEVINNGVLTVENIYYDIPTEAVWQEKEGTMTGSDFDAECRAAMYAAVQAKNVNVVTPVDGAVYNFGSLSFEIVYAPSSSLQSYITTNFGNNTSVIYKMITEESDVLFLGDAGVDLGNWLVANRADKIKADIVQMAHHGQNGVGENCYIAINPSIALWPTTNDLWNNTNPAWKTLIVRGWMEAIGTKNYVGKDGIIVLEDPYDFLDRSEDEKPEVPVDPEEPEDSEEPELPENVEVSGATFKDDGSVTLDGKVTPGGYAYHIAQIDNSYIAIKGEYGLDTYIDIMFTGNNMPQVLFFADQINGNMTSMGGAGVLFSNGIANAAMNQDLLRKYYIFGPNRITLHGGITDADKQVVAANWYETSDSRVINNANKLLIGYDSSGNASDYAFLTQKGLATTPDTVYKYTLGFYEKDGVIYAHIELYDVTNDVEVYNFDQATTLSASDLTAGNIILYGSVAGTANTTTFSYSEPYTKTQESPEEPEDPVVPEEPTIPENVEVSGATFNDDGSVTLDGKAAPGSYVYHVAQVDNSYVALKGTYGLDTYIDITFTGNNMPQVLFFADQINGNMTSMGGKGVLFSNGLVTANPAGSILRKYTIYGPNRIYLYGGITDSDKVVQNTNTYEGSDSRVINNANKILLGYDSSGNVKEYPYLTQKGLATTPDTVYKYTLGFYEKDGVIYAHIELYDVTNDVEVYNFDQATTLSASDLTAGNIILYGSVAGTANTTTFSYSEPYTKTQEEPEKPEDPVVPEEPTIPENVEASGATFNDDGSVTLEGKAAPGNYVYHVAQVDNSYVALKGTYGLDTYIDITFVGNNMPQVLFFADQINGNMTSMGGKGVLFSNGLVTANPTGSILRKYAIYGPNRIYLYGGITDSDKVVQNTNTYEGSDSRVISNTNKVLLGYDSSGNVSDYPFLTQKGLATTPDTVYKYTLGFYEKDGVVYAHIELYDVTNDVEVYNFDQATTLSASDLTAGNIILYGSVAGTANTTTFSYSEPYTKTQEEPEVPEEEIRPANSGATFNDDGSVTLEGKAAPGSYVYHVAQMDNSYVAIEGEYGLGTYIDITFKGNNMPQVMFFADQINGNMTSMGGKGVLFSNGLSTANPAGSILRKYAIYGPNRIYLYGGITDSDKVVQNTNTYEGSDSRVISNTNKILLGYDASGNVSDYPYLTQKGLATTPDTEYRYTLGMYEKDGVVYAHIELYNLTNDVEVYNFDQATTLSTSDLTAGSIILYGSVAGTANTTTFSYSKPYTKEQA